MKYRIDCICDLNKSSLTNKDRLDDILYLDTSSITMNRISELQTIKSIDAPSRAKRKVENKTIIYSTVRPNLKHFGILNCPKENMIVSTGFTTIDLKKEFRNEIIAEYLYYLLTNQSVTDYLATKAESAVSSYPSINPSDIGELTFSFPEIKIQEEVVNSISPIDQKIALNTRVNAELEAMAKQLYDYWFVQFDFPDENGNPYKSSGGKMVYNPTLKREIPAGWEVDLLGNLMEFSNGINYDKNINGDKEYNIINVRNITSSTVFIVKDDLDRIILPQANANKYLINEEDIIIARSGTPGATRLIDSPKDTIYCGFIIKGSPKYPWMKYYLFNILKQLEGTDATKTGGSILQNVSQDTLKGLPLVVPPKINVDMFNETIIRLFSRLNMNLEQSAHLIHLRDSLLPMLMNGQVTIEH